MFSYKELSGSLCICLSLIHTHTPNMVFALELFTSVLGKVKLKK